MTIRYDQSADTLTIILGPEPYEPYEYEAGGYTAVVDAADALVKGSIANASRFVARALAAGVKVEGAPLIQAPRSDMIWYDADSSMISAFGYDEAEGVLEAAFHSSGTYRYYDVPLHVFEGLRDASSKGSYMRAMIIDQYPTGDNRRRSR